MVNASALVNRFDVIHKQPEEGDFVMYFVSKGNTLRSEVGIIVKEEEDDGFFINGRPRFKDQVLFVLNLAGYHKQQRFSNSLAI